LYLKELAPEGTLNPTVHLYLLFSHPKQVTAKILRASQMPVTHSLKKRMTFLSKVNLLLPCEMLLFYPGPQKRAEFSLPTCRSSV
jgi:hypothetical protein